MSNHYLSLPEVLRLDAHNKKEVLRACLILLSEADVVAVLAAEVDGRTYAYTIPESKFEYAEERSGPVNNPYPFNRDELITTLKGWFPAGLHYSEDAAVLDLNGKVIATMNANEIHVYQAGYKFKYQLGQWYYSVDVF